MTLKLRRDTASEWSTANPVLALAQPGWETDTGKLKIGDGSTPWNSLSYWNPKNLKSKTITLENPENGNRFGMFQNEVEITITSVSFAAVNGTSVVFQLEFADLIGSGTIIHSDTCLVATPQWGVSPNGTATVPAERVICLGIGSVIDAVSQLTVTFYFEET